MAAAETSQIHAILLELHEVLVAVNAADYLSYPVQNPFANLLRLGGHDFSPLPCITSPLAVSNTCRCRGS
jgi:hypothetical protein